MVTVKPIFAASTDVLFNYPDGSTTRFSCARTVASIGRDVLNDWDWERMLVGKMPGNIFPFSLYYTPTQPLKLGHFAWLLLLQIRYLVEIELSYNGYWFGHNTLINNLIRLLLLILLSPLFLITLMRLISVQPSSGGLLLCTIMTREVLRLELFINRLCLKSTLTMVIILHLQHPITEQPAAKPISSNDRPPSTISPSTISDAACLWADIWYFISPLPSRH